MAFPTRTLPIPALDPTSIFEIFRGNHGTQLLTAAVAHLNVFGVLARKPLTLAEFRTAVRIDKRPAIVLTTALRAMGLLQMAANSVDGQQRLELTELARQHLAPGAALSVADYVGLAAESPDVLTMLECLRTNRPVTAAKEDDGAAFIFRQGIVSAMEREASARRLTLALAGRAKNVAPHLAKNLPVKGNERVLDVGGGTGLYSIGLLLAHPKMTAVVFDRPEVLKVAGEMAAQYGVAGRLELMPGDMFADKFPTGCELALLSNILHDWDEPQCQELIARCAAVLPTGGQLLIHDVFLNDALDGPLPIALYSAALFMLTEGRAYSAGEYRAWLQAAGLTPGEVIPTFIHCGVLSGKKG